MNLYKDRHVLVVSGAGASHNLGAMGAPIPMMDGWASELGQSLRFAAGVLGIKAGMSGPEFEEAIGRFLAFSRALPDVTALKGLGEVRSLFGQTQEPGADFNNWLGWATQNRDQIQLRIWQSLYKNFRGDRIDDEAAYEGYHALHELLRWSKDDGLRYISHATTNFDTAIESAVDLERQRNNSNIVLLDGFAAGTGRRHDQWSPNLFTASRRNHDGHIPVLHVHGAVGWYFEGDGIRRYPSDDDFDNRREPALLLPDSSKQPSQFPEALAKVWEQLAALLNETTHVLFLGQSLHDPHLNELVLSSQVQKVAAVAYTEPTKDGKYDLSNSTTADELRQQMPGITLIPGKFGQRNPSVPDLDVKALNEWLDSPVVDEATARH